MRNIMYVECHIIIVTMAAILGWLMNQALYKKYKNILIRLIM